jgi:energy-coupling factor transporter ATP-binding protein EcfA2
MTNSERINYFAETDYRGKKIKFGIKEGDRARHMYIIGKTGMGKSTLLENLAVQDIQSGEGLCFIDPHGSSAEMLLAYVPKHRIDDVVYFAPFDQEYPVALNVMEDIGHDKRALVASGLIGAFKKVWVDAWSPRMEYILNNALLALLETPGSTLLGVNRMFSDKSYRDLIVANVSDPAVLAFWRDEYAKYSDRFATEATAAIQNKVGQFVSNPLIRNIIGQPKSTFDIRKLMDEKKIFIVNLSKGRIGEGNANLIGSMLITKIYLAAMSRAEIHPADLHKLPAFYLYVDEFQSFANESFADILSEARKYKLALIIAHQYIEQMSEEVRAAVFGNVGTMISFRVGSYDAEVLEKEYAPQFTAQDMVSLGFAQIYLKLMIDGVGSQPFSATTLPRPAIPEPNFVREVIDRSRAQFGRPRADVEEEIRKWHEPVEGATEDSFLPKTRKYPSGERPQYPAQPTSSRPQPQADPSDRPQSRMFPVRPVARPQSDRPPRETPGVHRPFASALARAFEATQEGEKEENVPSPAIATEVGRPSEEVREVAPLSRSAASSVPPQPSIAEIQSALPPSSGSRQPVVSLASLKPLVKKDKGMTPERLSDLKAVLEKALASSGKDKEKGDERPAPPPETRREAREERPRPMPVSESEVEPSPRTVAKPRRAASEPKDKMGVPSAPAVRSAPTPDSQPSAPIRSVLPTVAPHVSVPVHAPRNDVPPEIPEDILRRVLRVD